MKYLPSLKKLQSTSHSIVIKGITNARIILEINPYQNSKLLKIRLKARTEKLAKNA